MANQVVWFDMPVKDLDRAIRFYSAVLGAPLIVVLAHTSCGAVKAACDVVTKNATYPGAIGHMIEPILPVSNSAMIFAHSR